MMFRHKGLVHNKTGQCIHIKIYCKVLACMYQFNEQSTVQTRALCLGVERVRWE